MNNSNNRPLGWTTLEEAKQLVEAGLPVETADMSYTYDFDDLRYVIETTPAKNWVVPKYAESTKIKQVLPCWSLGALINLLPLSFQSKEGFNYEYYLHFDILLDKIKPTYYIKQGHPMVAEKCETIIEACVEMIIWLLNNKFYE